MHPSIRIQRQVEFAETDMAGIVHFSNILKWMEAAEHAFFRDLGIPLIESYSSGIAGCLKVNVSCNFEAPVRFQDIIDITLTVKEVHTHSIQYGVQFFKVESGCKYSVAHGTMTTVFANINPHNNSIKSIPIDENLLNKLNPQDSKALVNPTKEC